MKLTPDAHATIDGKPGTAAKMIPDTEDKTTLVEMGSLRFHVIVRGERIGIRLKDVESPAVENFRGLTFYPPDLNYRVTAKWEPSDGKKTVDVPNVLGDVSPTTVSGTAVFKINGQEVGSQIWVKIRRRDCFSFQRCDQQDGHISGWTFSVHRSTVNGIVVFDFNRAHNPPCAVTAYATCPLAPKENRLPMAIPVGEKYDRAHGHH